MPGGAATTAASASQGRPRGGSEIVQRGRDAKGHSVVPVQAASAHLVRSTPVVSMRVVAQALLALLLACASPLRGVQAWGTPGHMVTASLAERHLSEGAAAAAASDLQVLKTLYPTESEFVTAADWRVRDGACPDVLSR